MADPPADPPAEPFLTLVEAAAATGLQAEAIRAKVRRGTLKAIKGNDGRTLVMLPAGMTAAAGRPGGRPGGRPAERSLDGRSANQGDADDDRSAGHTDSPAATGGAFPDAGGRLDTLAAGVTELAATFAQALELQSGLQVELAAERTRAEVAEVRLAEAGRAHEAELAALRREVEDRVAARNAVIEILQAEVERSRRPWWRKLVGA